MDRRAPDVVAVVKKLKDGARGSPWIPAGTPPRERYHYFPDGLSICFTLDILSKVYLTQLAQASGAKIPEGLVEGGRFWHLSIARLGARGPTPQEVDFWRQAFFGEEPIMEVGGQILGINSTHFFWRAK
ncbi:hypothetical protein LCGC14_0262270 [marine sediment metagenome]|uniref:Uncharacterized protein n=1 Tax=marine sediment metagenome TaxID=412755 RepID=A0A0F9X5V7_9ZZZZ